MDKREAIANLKFLISDDCCDTQMDYIDEIELAITALEMQIPKQPITNETAESFLCPVCDEFVGADCYERRYEKYYCENCGQAIDWRSED